MLILFHCTKHPHANKSRQTQTALIATHTHTVVTRHRDAPFWDVSRAGYTITGRQPATMRPRRREALRLTTHTCAPGYPGIRGATPTPEGGSRVEEEDDGEGGILGANRTAAACRVLINPFVPSSPLCTYVL